MPCSPTRSWQKRWSQGAHPLLHVNQCAGPTYFAAHLPFCASHSSDSPILHDTHLLRAEVSAGNNYEIGNLISEAMSMVGRQGWSHMKKERVLKGETIHCYKNIHPTDGGCDCCADCCPKQVWDPESVDFFEDLGQDQEGPDGGAQD